MDFKLPQRPKVSLCGVSRLALILGRACALRDNPVTGVYDPDPQLALRAALFLGVSARVDWRSLLADRPDLLICSVPCGEFEGFQINLFAERGGGDNVCWAESPGLGMGLGEVPTQITSQLPEVRFRLSGSEMATRIAGDFLAGVSTRISTSRG